MSPFVTGQQIGLLVAVCAIFLLVICGFVAYFLIVTFYISHKPRHNDDRYDWED